MIYIKGLKQTNSEIIITLTDVTGKIVKTVKNQVELQLNNLEKGIYFLSITGNNFKKVDKIVLQ